MKSYNNETVSFKIYIFFKYSNKLDFKILELTHSIHLCVISKI
ncbi:hypothetical protein LEP1GSC059_2944 [Leptospira noguchii serovar Panama str. CZ214]|uniref:Uncharacterized protein n=1 Tax=Leptospira noguchii serovar Panama str. CZ214 TaxID=1001595 RepID=T0FP02_9LEPT|nr:hypothetical protein LEP1GSC059_2944 [Leptospira noguchii serovar Panama str. CZ214]